MKSCYQNIKVGDKVIVFFDNITGIHTRDFADTMKEFPIIDVIGNAITLGSHNKYPFFAKRGSHYSSIEYEFPYYCDISFYNIHRRLVKIIKK